MFLSTKIHIKILPCTPFIVPKRGFAGPAEWRARIWRMSRMNKKKQPNKIDYLLPKSAAKAL